jgi:hypothetical protein
LYVIAIKVHQNHASASALTLNQSDDEQRPGIVTRGFDLLLYWAVRRAYKRGDVDTIANLMPELLFFFIGAGNSNYAIETFEFLQLITHEVTPAVR